METFLIGLGLAGLGIYLFFDSVHMSTAGMGLVSGIKMTPKGVLVGTDDPEPGEPPEAGEGDSK